MAFNVFVEGAVDTSPTAVPQLAEAMSQKYGIRASEFVSRLQRGRFRVKSNIDGATAERLKRDLEAIGARVLVEDAALSPTATPPVGVPTRPSTPSLQPSTRAASMSTPPSGLSAAGPQHARPATPVPSSGLSAAYSQEVPIQQDLGALGQSQFSLSSLDGEEAAPASNAFDMPPEPEKPVVNIVAKPKTTEPPRTKPVPSKALDLFAPPDAGDQGFNVDLATEEVAERAAKKASAPPENVTTTPVSSSSLPSMRKTPVAMDSVEAARPYELSRTRFATAVFVALALAFIPVHFIGKMREKSAYTEIDRKVTAAHASVESMDTYLALDGARRTLLEEKTDARQSIALTQTALWAVLAAAIAFGLLRAPAREKKQTA